MKTCANCGSEVPSNKSVCPNCGQPVASNAAWPPAPTNAPVPSPRNMGKLITGKRWGDLWVGFFTTWLLPYFVYLNLIPSIFVTYLGFPIALAIYFSLRRARPAFARGFGFGLISLVVMGLGAFVNFIASFDIMLKLWVLSIV